MVDMKKLMETLHHGIGEELLRRIQTGEATSADLSVARQFLKDNGIDASANQSEPLDFSQEDNRYLSIWGYYDYT